MLLRLILHLSILANDWKAANEELTVSCRYIIKNQTTGDRLNIRVVAVNPGGRSPPATLADAVLVREVVGKSAFYSHYLFWKIIITFFSSFILLGHNAKKKVQLVTLNND